jgi:hypothetical protein
MSIREITAISVFALTLASCAKDPSSIETASFDPNDPFLKYSEQEILEMFSGTSCNSFGGGSQVQGGVDYTRGLRGRMKSAPALNETNYQPWFDLNRFDQPDAINIDGQVFFDNLNVPTRLFIDGFPTLGGGLVQGPAGPLIEFFRIDFDGEIELSPEAFSEDYYQFAAISDDGVIMKINGQTIINDPYVTPPKLMCGTQNVFMVPEQPMSFELAYSQAPRFHIALVLLWRKVTPQTQAEPACGYNGTPGPGLVEVTSAWFDWQLPGSPGTQAYQNLLSRGWSVVPRENFKLPQGVNLNPCSSAYVQSVFARNGQ